MPGGVNSPVRAFGAVGGEPFFVASGHGAYLDTVDGRSLVDMVCAFGPLLLGHALPEVVAALQRQATSGSAYGAPTEAETELVELLIDHVPSVQMARLVNSGTEATMSAIRLARGATGREVIVKFAGGYHGHADHLLAEAGSGLATFGIPGSAGVPPSLAALTAVLPYNSIPALEAFFAAEGRRVAAVIVEPVAGNMGVVPASPGFLEACRRLTAAHGSILIFDEVITGFRLGLAGAQGLYGIRPDLTCLGKIIGGGLPLAAYGGSVELMSQLAPDGPVYQAGTLSGNPMATAAGLATLRVLAQNPPYEAIDRVGGEIEAELVAAAAEGGVGLQVNRVGSMLTPFFTAEPVTDYDSARASDTGTYRSFFQRLLSYGVYVPPSQFEAWFVSRALADGPSDVAVAAVGRALRSALG